MTNTAESEIDGIDESRQPREMRLKCTVGFADQRRGVARGQSHENENAGLTTEPKGAALIYKDLTSFEEALSLQGISCCSGDAGSLVKVNCAY
jgi:hypothetical protein